VASSPTISRFDLDGLTFIYDSDANATIEKDVMEGPCTLLAIWCDMDTNSVLLGAFLKLYDDVNPTVGTTDPTDVEFFEGKTLAVDTDKLITTRLPNAGKGIKFPKGLSFAFVAWVSATDGPGTSGTGNPVTQAAIALVLKKGIS